MSTQTIQSLQELLEDGNINNIEERLFDMYQSTLLSQDTLGELSASSLSNYLHTIRGIVNTLRLLEKEIIN